MTGISPEIPALPTSLLYFTIFCIFPLKIYCMAHILDLSHYIYTTKHENISNWLLLLGKNCKPFMVLSTDAKIVWLNRLGMKGNASVSKNSCPVANLARLSNIICSLNSLIGPWRPFLTSLEVINFMNSRVEAIMKNVAGQAIKFWAWFWLTKNFLLSLFFQNNFWC